MTARTPERGAALLVTMFISIAVLGGAAALVSLQVTSTRTSTQSRASMTALHCAESGLVTARAAVTANHASWNAALAGGAPAWLAAIDRDLDDDGDADFTLTLRDNDDELPPLVPDPTRDNDLAVLMTSTCIADLDVPITVTELVQHSGGGNCYEAQLGGCGGNNNAN